MFLTCSILKNPSLVVVTFTSFDLSSLLGDSRWSCFQHIFEYFHSQLFSIISKTRLMLEYEVWTEVNDELNFLIGVVNNFPYRMMVNRVPN